jgi:BirA family transcriptional regulator, biotin operon repressor / biotin---[acetyl-CoA-carboxylase] ligase
MARLGTLPFVAACALHATLAELKPLKTHDIQIKWPNDILVGGAKISGILLESSALPNGKIAVACGFGINAAHHPDPVLYKATDLKTLGLEISPEALFAQLSVNFDAVLTVWNRGRGFDAVRTEWLRHAKGIGEMISVNLAGTRIDGIFEDIDRDGCLMLALANGQRQLISAGDVFFPAHSGATS